VIDQRRGFDGDAPGDGRRQGSGSASATARIPAEFGAVLGHGCTWELRWGLGKELKCLGGREHKRRRELTGSANGGRLCCSGACEGKAGRVFIGRATPRGSFSRASLATVATAWRGGGWRRAAGRRPMAEGSTRAGVCAAAAWHRPRGGAACHAM
jgi:hypothetical protein